MPQNELTMQLYSRRPLDADFARRQIQALISFSGGEFLPEKCDVFEPLRERFDPNNFEKPVTWLSRRGGRFMFKRSRPLRTYGYIANVLVQDVVVRDEADSARQHVTPVSQPLFCTQWSVWLDEKLGEQKHLSLAQSFLSEMFTASECDFGFLTPQTDFDSKNFQTIQDGRSTLEMYVGNDPAKGLPGLYWINILGPVYVRLFGDRLSQIPATLVRNEPAGAVLVQFGKLAADAVTAEVLDLQKVSIRRLGEQYFFDIREPGKPLQTPYA